MFNIELVQIGDILQHKPVGFLGAVIKFFTFATKNNNYAHTAMYVGNGMKVEAHSGKKFGPVVIQPDEFDRIDIYRVRGGLTAAQKKSLVDAAKKKYGLEYDGIGLIGTLRSSIGVVTGWGWIRNTKPIMNDESKLFCSEAIGDIYFEGLHIDLDPSTNSFVTNPNDITRDLWLLEKIS